MYSLNAGGADYWIVATKINGDFKLLFLADSSASNICPNLFSAALVRTGVSTSDIVTDSGITVTSI